MEYRGYAYLLQKKYERAQSDYKKELKLCYEVQERMHQRLHKGVPLHNLGLTLILQGRVIDGACFVVAAFFEDVLTIGPEECLNGLAARVLKEMHIENESLRSIAIRLWSERAALLKYFGSLKDKFIRRKNGELWIFESHFVIPKDPPPTITPESMGAPLSSIMSKIYANLMAIGGTKQRRVFVGGSYRNIALLRQVSTVVDERRPINTFKPILVADLPVKFSASESHDASIQLLYYCGIAIFEVSFPDGHMMEIERCHDIKDKDPSFKVLMIWQTEKRKRMIDRSLPSRMLMTSKFDKGQYTRMQGMVMHVHRVLK